MIPAKGHGEELDFSLAAQRQQLYQSLSTSMPGATTQTAADAPRLGGLGGALQQRPAGPLGGGGGGGGGGLGMSVPSFAAALDEHSQRIQAQQAQAASKMASMLQQDQAAALYQQSATAAAAQRQVGGQPQAQQQGPGGMTQQQFSHLSHQAYTVQQFAQQHAAQQLAAQQAAAKAQQHAQRHAQQAQQLMRTNQAAAAGRKAHSASGAPRSLPLQSAQQPPTTGAARGKAAAQTTKDLKASGDSPPKLLSRTVHFLPRTIRSPMQALPPLVIAHTEGCPATALALQAIVAAHREELGQVIVWRRAVYNEHNAACDDEEDAALTRCAADRIGPAPPLLPLLPLPRRSSGVLSCQVR